MTLRRLAAGLLLALPFALGTAQAQTAPEAPVGLAAGTFMVRLRAIGVIPEDNSSSISLIGGSVHASAQAAPEVDVSYFLTDHIAFELIAASTEHTITATNTALGKVDVGSTWILPPTLTVQYHFMPHSRFSPYLGAGLNVSFFYASHAAGGTVTKLGLDNAVGPALQAGFDYNVSGHWFANFDVKQIFLSTTAHLNGGVILAKTALDPLVIGAGIGYRF
ncbi:MAG TPA: OmpW family outer membrane protein [Acetobacteraceae bacterium]|nr:OmpW family outer membrane protein [Acetobacteraceae bacterium]